MKYFITLFFLSFSIVAHSQVKTKKIVIKHKESTTKEIIYVLKSDKTIYHGAYQKIKSGQVYTSGFYDMGKKDGLWTEYRYRNIHSKGFYKNDNKVGVWEYYDTKGNLEQKYNHTTDELTWIDKKYTNLDWEILYDGKFQKINVDRKPVYKESYSTVLLWILQIGYPREARRQNLQGKVVIEFQINEEGNVSNYIVKESAGKILDNAVLNRVKEMPRQWLPALKDGKPVVSKMSIPFTFKLN